MQINRIVLFTVLIVLLLPVIALAAGGGGDQTGLNLVEAIGMVIIASSVLLVVFNAIRMPALLAYIATGLLLSAVASEFLASSIHTMEHISHLGLVFLLFIIGMEMDLGGIMKLGFKTALAVLLQAPIAIATVLGVLYLGQSLGFSVPGVGDNSASFIFFAVACALGSTAVVVKLLGDKFDLDSHAGKITVLTLIAEDIWAVLALSYVAAQSGSGGGNPLIMIGGGVGITLVLVVFSRYVLSRLLVVFAKSPDLLALIAMGWCFLGASALTYIGLSAEMGALIAGVTIGALPQHTEILSKVSSLRDFFMALFFVTLGLTLPFPDLTIIIQSVVLTVIVILVRMVLYTPTLLWARLGKNVAFTVPVNLAQISEFTLLLIPIGLANHSLTVEQGSIISYALMLSVIVSTFTIGNNYRISRFLVKYFTRADKAETEPVEGAGGGGHGAEIMMLGYYHNAQAFAVALKEKNPELMSKVLVIDFNLQNHANIRSHGFKVAYGDISNFDTLRHQGIGNAKVIISTISNTFLRGISNEELVDQIRNVNPNAMIISTADDDAAFGRLKHRQIFAVVRPPMEAAPSYVNALFKALETLNPVTDEADNESKDSE